MPSALFFYVLVTYGDGRVIFEGWAEKLRNPLSHIQKYLILLQLLLYMHLNKTFIYISEIMLALHVHVFDMFHKSCVTCNSACCCKTLGKPGVPEVLTGVATFSVHCAALSMVAQLFQAFT